MISPFLQYFSRAGAVIGVVAATAVIPAHAEGRDYTGKRIEMVVPFAAGGGSSAYAQFMALMLKEKLPGNPTVVIKNVPGGGSITGMNEFVRRAKPDGLTIATTGTSGLMNYLLKNPAIQFGLDDFDAVIASPAGVIVYASSKLGIKNPQDIAKLKGRKVTIGGNGPTAADLPVLLSLDMLGLDLNAVFGIEGGGPRRQAFQRGEFDINFDTAPSYQNEVVPLIEDGSAVPLFTFGISMPDGSIVRDPAIPNLPTFLEFYEAALGQKPTGPQFAAWKTLFAARVMAGKVIVLPANCPPDVVEAYLSALKAAVNDPQFKSDQGVEIVGPYEQPMGTDAATVFRAAGQMSDSEREWLVGWLKKKFDVKL